MAIDESHKNKMKYTIIKSMLTYAVISIYSISNLYSASNFDYYSRFVGRSFQKKDYNAANQNWSISQSPNGFMYFGNTAGLLEYNGKEWTLYELPDKLIIRSVFADKDGLIYTGAHEELGYWKRDTFGKLHYTSLVNLLPKSYSFSNEDFWNIKKFGNKLYFQTFAKLYIYDGKRITVKSYGKPVFTLIDNNGVPYLSLIGGGLHKVLNNSELQKITDVPENIVINNLITISSDTTIIVSETKLFLMVKGSFRGEWQCNANKILANALPNRSLLIQNEGIALGTINDGIYLINQKGDVIKNWNTNNGLQNNTVLSIFIDHSKNLWVGLDKGVEYINLRSPFKLFLEGDSSIGSVYCAAVKDNHLYVGTNHGLFVSKWDNSSGKNLKFTFIDNVKGQVWNLQHVGDLLICGANMGTFAIDKGAATRISTTNGGNLITQPVDDKNIMFQGTYTGISIFKKGKNGSWVYSMNLKNFWPPVKTLQFDHENTLWVGDIYKGLYRIWLNDSKDAAVKVEKFGKKDGFTSDYNIQVYKIGNNLVFTNLNKIYSYDYVSHKIVENSSINRQINSYTQSHTIFNTGKDEYWFAKSNSIQQFIKKDNDLTPAFQISYKAIGTSAVDGYENIWKLSDNTYLVGLDNGFLLYDAQNWGSDKTAQLGPNIYRVETFTNNGEMKLASIDSPVNKIAFNRRNIIFYISTPGEIDGLCSYSYRFDNAGKWIELKESSIATNSLSAGKHVLFIKSVNRTSNKELVKEYRFTIRLPWYGHPVTLALYLILLYLGYRSVIHIIRLRHRRQKYEDLKKMKEHKRIQFENLQKDHLIQQVESKANELANYTMLMRTKTEVLLKIKKIIDDTPANDSTAISRMKKSIIALLEKNLSNKNEWEQFQNYFDEANQAFTARLKKQHSDLTPNDLRFCSFLRMNLNSKEISQLFNISERSVEVKRYRLRKRLNIEHDKNLTEYLMDM